MSIKNQLSIEEDGAFISIKEKGGHFPFDVVKGMYN